MLSDVLHWLDLGGLPLLFFLVLLEGNPIVGSFIPGQFLVIFVGFIISTTHSHSVFLTVLLVFIGAFLGDLIGFYMGKYLGIGGLNKFGVSKDNTIYRSSRSFFKKYGIFAIILGRELNPTRAFIPFLAGSMKMKDIKFISIAAISCFIWSTLSVYLGYYFGNIIVNNFKFFIEFLVVLIIYLIFVIFTYKKFKSFLNQNLDFIKEYSLYNVLLISFLFAIFIILCFILKWNYNVLFNDYFAFILIPGLYVFTGFLLSKYFFACLCLFMFAYLSIKKEIKLFITFVWGFVFSFFYTIMFTLFLKTFFNIQLYYSVIGSIYFLFFIWIIGKRFFKKKFYVVLDVFLISIFMLIVLTKFSLNGDLFLTVLSVIVSAILCEFLVILSNIGILDKSLAEISNS